MTCPTPNVSNHNPVWNRVHSEETETPEAIETEVSATIEEGVDHTKTLPELPAQASPTAIDVLSQLMSGTPPSPIKPTKPELPDQASATAVDVHLRPVEPRRDPRCPRDGRPRCGRPRPSSAARPSIRAGPRRSTRSPAIARSPG